MCCYQNFGLFLHLISANCRLVNLCLKFSIAEIPIMNESIIIAGGCKKELEDCIELYYEGLQEAYNMMKIKHTKSEDLF